jgi:hypothetical protein
MEMAGEASAELLKQLNEGKVVQLTPQGISMLPFIQGGRDKVRIRKEDKVSVGDIVLVPHGGHLILHRVYAMEGTRLTLMGDGNLKGNEEVDKSEVWGTVIEIVKPDGRYCKPHKAWLWRHTKPFRRLVLKLRRKWYKLRNLDPE